VITVPTTSPGASVGSPPLSTTTTRASANGK
jgi:hypothetical protein